MKEFGDAGINMIFNNRNSIYICRTLYISTKKSEEGYHEYYNDSIHKLTTWSQISELKVVDKNIMEDLIVLSNGKKISEIINKPMASFFSQKLKRIS